MQWRSDVIHVICLNGCSTTLIAPRLRTLFVDYRNKRIISFTRNEANTYYFISYTNYKISQPQNVTSCTSAHGIVVSNPIKKNHRSLLFKSQQKKVMLNQQICFSVILLHSNTFSWFLTKHFSLSRIYLHCAMNLDP